MLLMCLHVLVLHLPVATLVPPHSSHFAPPKGGRLPWLCQRPASALLCRQVSTGGACLAALLVLVCIVHNPAKHQHQLQIQNELCCCNLSGAGPSFKFMLGFEATNPAVLLLLVKLVHLYCLAVVHRSSKLHLKYLNTCVLWWLHQPLTGISLCLTG